MAVLVTGGAGYIGSHVAHSLCDAGQKTVVVDDLSTGFASAVPPHAQLFVGDVADAGLLQQIDRDHGIDAIIHLAGSVVVPDSVADPLGYYLNNTVKSRALIAWAVAAGVRNFIFSSTAAVYGNPVVVPVDEQAPLQPLSPYGRSKLMTEMMLADAAVAHDLRYVALRYFNVAGADPAGRTGQSTKGATHLLKVACEAAVGRRDGIDVFGTDYPTRDGTCIRDFIHVSDLAQAHLAALSHLRRGGTSQVLNCGYSHGFTVLELIETVKEVSGSVFPVRHAPRRAGDSVEVVADCSRLRAELGWKPQHDDLRGIVGDALRWERSRAAQPERQTPGTGLQIGLQTGLRAAE
jgi:UDP-glucose 4-epimerase